MHGKKAASVLQLGVFLQHFYFFVTISVAVKITTPRYSAPQKSPPTNIAAQPDSLAVTASARLHLAVYQNVLITALSRFRAGFEWRLLVCPFVSLLAYPLAYLVECLRRSLLAALLASIIRTHG